MRTFHGSGLRPWVLWVCLCGALALQGCSAVRLGYQQLPQLAYWQLNSYVGLTDPQAERVRDELAQLHRWHRTSGLPQHAQWLQGVQQKLVGDVSAEHACSAYGELRGQLEQVLAQAEPALAWLASQLTESQLQQIRTKQSQGNAEWKEEWLDPSTQAVQSLRFSRLLSRAENLYGPLDAAQKELLRDTLAASSWDAQRSYAERLRRQQDLLQTLQHIQRAPGDAARTRSLLRAYTQRLSTSPDADYERAARAWLQENCTAFARMHNQMTDNQRRKAAQALGRYQSDFAYLAQR